MVDYSTIEFNGGIYFEYTLLTYCRSDCLVASWDRYANKLAQDLIAKGPTYVCIMRKCHMALPCYTKSKSAQEQGFRTSVTSVSLSNSKPGFGRHFWSTQAFYTCALNGDCFCKLTCCSVNLLPDSSNLLVPS